MGNFSYKVSTESLNRKRSKPTVGLVLWLLSYSLKLPTSLPLAGYGNQLQIDALIVVLFVCPDCSLARRLGYCNGK